MNRTRLAFMFFLLSSSLLLLPASAPETPATRPAAPAADEPDAPPDLGENVSADHGVSFPMDL